MNIKDAMGFLGICRKAGRLVCGHDAVVETLRNSQCRLVMLSSDASARLVREMEFECLRDGRSIEVLKTACSMEDFAAGIGKRSAVYSVTDDGFANKLKQKFGEELDGN